MKKKSIAKKPVAKKAAVKKAAPKKAGAKAGKVVGPVFGKHIHPYGTAHHGDVEWQLNRLEQSLAKFDAAGQASIRKALALSQERHGSRLHTTGGSYVIHPVRVANILINEWAVTNPDLIAAAILHDIVEDTATTLKEIKDSFGNDVGKLVDGMTMWKGSETYEIYVKRVARGPEDLRLIKCAEELDTLRSWFEVRGDEPFHRWWLRTQELILPMAQSVSLVAMTAIHRVLADPWYSKKAGMDE